MRRLFLLLSCVACALPTMSSAVWAGFGLSRTYRGDELAADSQHVSFPTRVPTVDGMSLVFGAGTERFEKLISIPLLPGGELPGVKNLVVGAELTLTRMGTDLDPNASFSDGTSLVGFKVVDQATHGYWERYDDLGDWAAFQSQSELVDGGSMAPVGQTVVFGTHLLISSMATRLRGINGTAPADVDLGEPFGWESPLSFVFLANDDAEVYRIETLTLIAGISGDADLDGDVELLDFSILKQHFGESDATWAEGDFNLDRLVDLTDFNLLKSNFAVRVSTVGEAAEPSAAVLWFAGLMVLACRAILPRRRRGRTVRGTLGDH